MEFRESIIIHLTELKISITKVKTPLETGSAIILKVYRPKA